MAVSYKKLFKILIDRDMKKKEFRDFVGISYSTMSKLEKGENTTVEVLEKICLKLGCGINDIMEILPDDPRKWNRKRCRVVLRRNNRQNGKKRIQRGRSEAVLLVCRVP